MCGCYVVFSIPPFEVFASFWLSKDLEVGYSCYFCFLKGKYSESLGELVVRWHNNDVGRPFKFQVPSFFYSLPSCRVLCCKVSDYYCSGFIRFLWNMLRVWPPSSLRAPFQKDQNNSWKCIGYMGFHVEIRGAQGTSNKFQYLMSTLQII